MKRLLFLYLLFLLSCHSSKKQEHLFTLPGEWPADDSVSKKIKQHINEGAVEEFSINGSKFRFLKDKQRENSFDLQVQENDQWINNLELKMPQYEFFISNDFDLDNSYDLSFIEYGDIKIYFYDNAKRRFSENPLQFSYDYAFLDKTKLIYGANEHKNSDFWNVDIFSIKSRVKTYLYKAILPIDNINKKGTEVISASIYSCRNGNAGDTLLIEKREIHQLFGEFNLNHFMKDLAHRAEKE